MKSVLFAAVLLASPALTFAGGQPNRMHAVSKADTQDRTGISPTVNQGKGAGLSRKQVVSPAQTALRKSAVGTAFSK
jgi:hypothetical protein